MYSVTEGKDVNGTAKFCVPWAFSLEQFASNSARQQFVYDSVQGAAKDVSLRSWLFGTAGTFSDGDTVYSDLLTYLLKEIVSWCSDNTVL